MQSYAKVRVCRNDTSDELISTMIISADSWFAIIYTVIAEITPVEIHGITTALFLFILNNIAGNLPIVVAPLSGLVGLRGALFIMSPMLVGVSKLTGIVL